MKIRLLILSILFTLTVGFVSFKVTHALFSDAAQSQGNTFAAADIFPTTIPTVTPTPTPTSTPTPTPTQIPALVINEVSPEGNANEEWVEIFNPTGSEVNVSGWKITDALTHDTFPTVAPIPAGGYAVVIGNASIVSVPASAVTITLGNSTIGSGLNNPGDLVRLRTPSDITVDEMSYGTNTTVFPVPPAAPDDEAESLARSPNGVDTNTAADWVIDLSPSIGVAN